MVCRFGGDGMSTYENKSSSNFRYLGRITKDLFTIMPFEVSGILLIKILSAAAAFVQVYISAAFFDIACRFFEGTWNLRCLYRFPGGSFCPGAAAAFYKQYQDI